MYLYPHPRTFLFIACRDRGRERETSKWERSIVQMSPICSWTRNWGSNCALTRNQTHSLSVRRQCSNQLSHTVQSSDYNLQSLRNLGNHLQSRGIFLQVLHLPKQCTGTETATVYPLTRQFQGLYWFIILDN